MFGAFRTQYIDTLTYECIYPGTKTSVGPCGSYKDVFALTQHYFQSSYSSEFWKYFTPEPSEDGWREKFIRRYKHYYDVDEKHACALANFKVKFLCNHRREKRKRNEHSPIAVAANCDQCSKRFWYISRSISETAPRSCQQCGGHDYYVRPENDESREKRLCVLGVSGMFRGLARFCSSIMPTMHL